MRTLLAAALLVSCAAPAATPSTTAPSAATASPSPAAGASGTRYGVAGLIPPRFPKAAASDHEAMYASFASTGGAVGVYTNWADAGREGAIPNVVTQLDAARATYGFGPLVVALGVAQDAPGGVRSTVDWRGPQREAFVRAASALAGRLKPEFLALGVESNRLFASDPAAFDGFVAGYGEAYDAVKKVSPATKVFTVFQLELMRGAAYLVTAKQSTPPQWDLLGRFAGRLDLAGFTTYPFLHHPAPADLPADYYADAARRAGVPVAFTEVGWPSERIAATPSGYDGSPEEQAAFVTRFFALTADVRPALALWSFPYDLGAAGPPTFASVGLRSNDGAPKPALAAWQAGIGRR